MGTADHLEQLGGNPFRGNMGQPLPIPVQRRRSFRFYGISPLGSKPQSPQNPQGILL